MPELAVAGVHVAVGVGPVPVTSQVTVVQLLPRLGLRCVQLATSVGPVVTV